MMIPDDNKVYTLEELKAQKITPAPDQRRGHGINATESRGHTIEDHHRAVGGFLKMAEAALTDLRYTRYLHDGDVGKALDKIVKAIQGARPVLDRRRFHALGGRPGGDTYFGPELDALQKLVYAIETTLKAHDEELQAQRKLDRTIPLDRPEERRRRRLDLAHAQRAPLADYITQELQETIGAVVTAARERPQLFPKDTPPALMKPAERHSLLGTMLIENPDQPQATFVKLCRVHPNTVRRCRRELEEAGVIPFLAHRHAA